MKIIGYIAITIIVGVFSTIVSGWALAKLWAWFIVRTFDLPPLSIPAAIGFALVINYLTEHPTANKKDDRAWSEVLLYAVVLAIFRPAFALGIGLIVKAWI